MRNAPSARRTRRKAATTWLPHFVHLRWSPTEWNFLPGLLTRSTGDLRSLVGHKVPSLRLGPIQRVAPEKIIVGPARRQTPQLWCSYFVFNYVVFVGCFNASGWNKRSLFTPGVEYRNRLAASDFFSRFSIHHFVESHNCLKRLLGRVDAVTHT